MRMYGAKFMCKGKCERYHFKKRANYNCGELYCRKCEISIPVDIYFKLPQLNPVFKYCFCCHTRLATTDRDSHNKNIDNKKIMPELRTFEALGIPTIKQDMTDGINARKRREKHARY